MQSRGSRAVLLFGCVVLLAGVGFGSACPTGHMDLYDPPGYACTIGDKTFGNFIYTSDSNPPGFEIPAGGVSVTPITTPGNPGFTFSAGWFASTTSGILQMDSLIQYSATVNPGGTPITDLSLSIAGVDWTGTGAISVAETVCLGAMLPSCSGGTIRTLSVFDSAGGTQLFDSITFSGVTFVDVAKDIQIEAGTSGMASVSLVTNQFSEQPTPEPGSIMLFGSGVLGLAAVLRRKLSL